MRDNDPFEVANLFEEKRISFAKMIEDPEVVQSEDLVVRWDDE